MVAVVLEVDVLWLGSRVVLDVVVAAWVVRPERPWVRVVLDADVVLLVAGVAAPEAVAPPLVLDAVLDTSATEAAALELALVLGEPPLPPHPASAIPVTATTQASLRLFICPPDGRSSGRSPTFVRTIVRAPAEAPKLWHGSGPRWGVRQGEVPETRRPVAPARTSWMGRMRLGPRQHRHPEQRGRQRGHGGGRLNTGHVQ